MDLELEAQIDILRDNKKKYENILKLAQTLSTQLFQMVHTQKQLGDAFADLSLKSLELHVSLLRTPLRDCGCEGTNRSILSGNFFPFMIAKLLVKLAMLCLFGCWTLNQVTIGVIPLAYILKPQSNGILRHFLKKGFNKIYFI